MSEYWKSVPRKFCDFCKCWITDNKPSVDFHERGKRHQEAVQRRLKEVRKKSYEQSKEDDTISKQMEKMEKAALQAFKKDLAADPSLAKQYGVSLEPKPKPQPDGAKETSNSSEKEWYESKSPEGYSYYWSTVTGESRWEAPDKFVSIEEQEEEKSKEEQSKEEQSKEEQTEDASSTEVDNAKESLHTTVENKQTLDPNFSRSAFGAWSVVKEESQPVLYHNLSEAPLPGEIPLPQDIPLPKPETPKFKEKTVKSLAPPSSSSDSAMPVFKKRKVTSGARNSRQRGGDD